MPRRAPKVTCVEVLVVISIVFILIGMLFPLTTSFLFPFMNNQTHEINVERVESVSSSSQHRYLIYTDGEVFEDRDFLVKGKFDSSDSYNKLKDLGKFKVKTCGYRLPFFSLYRCILEVEKVEEVSEAEESFDSEKEQRRLEYEKLKKEFE